MQSPQFAALTDEQILQIQEYLLSADGAMDIEEVDGFFCALISGPNTVMPSEYLPHLFGGGMPDIGPGTQGSEILGLLFHHWNHIADTLMRGELHFPLLFQDEPGKANGNDWAHGFMRGVDLRRESWNGLIEDEDSGGMMLPVMTLDFETDEAPDLERLTITDDERKDLKTHMTVAILDIFQYFVPQRKQGVRVSIERNPPKIGRNVSCPCGSGKKFKKCCGSGGTDPTLH
jgi:uncharacterized protein